MSSNSVLARQENEQFQLTITIPQASIKSVYDQEVKKAAEGMEVAGFRKGKAPLEKVEDRLDKNKLYELVIRKLLPSIYAEAVQEHQLKPIIEPKIELIKIKEAEDWQIRATAAQKPVVELNDYKPKLNGILKTTEIWTPDQGVPAKARESSGNQETKSASETTEEQAAKIREWLLSNVKVQPADILIEQQANQLLARLLDQIQKLGLTLDQYLHSLQKKVEDLKADYSQRARQDLRFDLIILAIGEEQKITVNDEEIEQLINQNKDEALKNTLNTPEQKQYLNQIIFRQKVFDYLFKLAAGEE